MKTGREFPSTLSVAALMRQRMSNAEAHLIILSADPQSPSDRR
jgi:hypothetical protein